jgi:hypothetical protein
MQAGKRAGRGELRSEVGRLLHRANPVGALWRIVPADKVTAGMEVAKTKGN